LTQILYNALKAVEFISLNEYDPGKDTVCPGAGILEMKATGATVSSCKRSGW